MKKILVVCYGGGHVNMVIPVITKLRNLGFEVKILGLTAAESVFRKNGLESFGFRHYLSLFKDGEAIIEQGHLLLKQLPLNKEILEEESVAYLGLSYWDLVHKYGQVEALSKYMEHGRYCFYQTNVLEMILKYEKPDFLISTSSPRSELASLEVSKKLNIPNACLIDLYIDLLEARLKNNKFIDKFFVPSGFELSSLVKIGISEDRIVISGNPAFEGHFSPAFIDQADRFKKEKFPKKKTIITFAKTSSYSKFARVDQEILQGLLTFINGNTDFGLIVRNHPNDTPVTHKEKGVFYSTKNEPIAVILHASDIVVSQGSTVGIEARFVGNTVIQYSDQEFSDLVDQERMGIATKVKSIAALHRFLDGYTGVTKSTPINSGKDSSVIVEYIKNTLVN